MAKRKKVSEKQVIKALMEINEKNRGLIESPEIRKKRNQETENWLKEAGYWNGIRHLNSRDMNDHVIGEVFAGHCKAGINIEEPSGKLLPDPDRWKDTDPTRIQFKTP